MNDKGKMQVGRTPVRSNTDDMVGGGLDRSSEEGAVMELERRVKRVPSEPRSTTPLARQHRKTDWYQTKGHQSFLTPKHFLDAYKKVKKNKGSAGVDRVSLKDFERNLVGNLMCLWNRVLSGSYFPPAVKEVGIAKEDGRVRYLGIPTVGDRIVQQVIKKLLEPRFEQEFLDCSYGYRSGRSAHDALQVVRLGVLKRNWVIDLDVASFFDELPHDLLGKALDRHVPECWIRRLLDRWLQADIEPVSADRSRNRQGRGTPQGGVVSPLLANLFLHYTLDKWLKIHYPEAKLVRYADDAIIMIRTRRMTFELRAALEKRFSACGLRLHPEKTRVVYCKNFIREDKHRPLMFDFLGFRFRPLSRKRKDGSIFLSFDCTISQKNLKGVKARLRSLKFHLWTSATMKELADKLNPLLEGWLNYYGRFGLRPLRNVMKSVNERLAKWLCRKYKRFGKSARKAHRYLRDLARRNPSLFAHWKRGIIET